MTYEIGDWVEDIGSVESGDVGVVQPCPPHRTLDPTKTVWAKWLCRQTGQWSSRVQWLRLEDTKPITPTDEDKLSYVKFLIAEASDA